MRIVARMWADGESVRAIEKAIGKSRSQVWRYLRKPEVLAEIRRISDPRLGLVVPKLIAKGLEALDQISEDLALGNESMVRMLQNRTLIEPVVRLASTLALAAGKSSSEVGADVRAAEIRRFLAAADAMESGGEALPAVPPGGPADGG